MRPSEIYHISDPLSAFYFDRMVYLFGSEVEGAMSEAAEGAKSSREARRKRSMALARYLKEADGSPAPGTFRDPSVRAHGG